MFRRNMIEAMSFRITSAWLLPCFAAFLCTVVLSMCNGPTEEGGSRAGSSSQSFFSQGEAYERFMGRWSQKLAASFVQFAGVGSGNRVLDVGCGTGALTAAVLPLVDSGRVVGVDPSQAYVDFARSRIDDKHATFEPGDGQQLEFSNSAFDATLSLLVINFIPAPARALDEMIRVTRPGGVVAAAVWDYGEGMEPLRLFWDEAVSLNPSAEDRDERHMPLCRQGELTRFWTEHGLVDVQEEGLVVERTFPSFGDFWAPFLEGQGPAGAYVASLAEPDRTALEKGLRRRLEAGPDGAIRLRARAWAVKGVVPRR